MKKKLTKEQKRQQANKARKNQPVVIHLNSYPSQMESEKVRKFMCDGEELLPFHEAAHLVVAKSMQPQFNWAYGKLDDGRWGCIPDGNPRMKLDLNAVDAESFFYVTAAGYAGELAALGILPENDSKGNYNPEFVECMNRLYGNALNAYRLSEQGLMIHPLMNDDYKLVWVLKHGGMSDSKIIKYLTIVTGMIVDELLDDGTNAEWKKEVANFRKISEAA